MIRKFKVFGMSCAACSSRVDRAVRAVPGVREANVSLLTNSMTVTFDEGAVNTEEIAKAVSACGYRAQAEGEAPSASPRAPEKEERAGALLFRLIASLILTLGIMYLSMGGMLGLPLPSCLSYPLVAGLIQLYLLVPVLILNREFFVGGYRALKHFSPNMFSLISIGVTASTLYSLCSLTVFAYNASASVMAQASHLYFESAAMILTLITLGRYFEAKAKGRTSDAIAKLIDLKPRTARVLREGSETEIPAEQLAVGDIVIVREGEAIPTDGVITEGGGSVDQSMLTGESAPADLTAGDEVTGATVNRSGSFRFRATRVGADTRLSRIVSLVEEAANSKAPVSRLADKVSGVFVPAVLLLALATGLLWFFLGGAGIGFSLECAVCVLVISCPCALGLATPTAIMAGTGRGAEMGVLIRSAAAIEALKGIDTVVFDKTGTLTSGEMRVSACAISEGMSISELLRIAASAERESKHPLGMAIVRHAEKENVALSPAEEVETVPGQGLRAKVDGRRVLIGNARMMDASAQDVTGWPERAGTLMESGATVLYVAADGHVLGLIGLTDDMRPSARDAVDALTRLNVNTLMLTGDNERTARGIARAVGIQSVRAQLMPEDKEIIIRTLKEDGKHVLMVGDGINDAPALARADLGMAVGNGTDVAIESADIVMMGEDVTLVPGVIRLGRAVMRVIKQNLFWAFCYNIIGIPIAAGALYPAFGLRLSPMIGAAAMSLSSICVVTNALRLRRFRPDMPETVKKAAACEIVKTAPEPPKAEETGRDASADGILENQEEKNPMIRTVSISGMMCAHCKGRVEQALSELGLIAQVDLDAGTARITGDASEDAIRTAVKNAGYEVTSVQNA